jgi:hypothetical protein
MMKKTRHMKISIVTVPYSENHLLFIFSAPPLNPGPGYYVRPGLTFPHPANVKLKLLPFYDIHGELLRPTALLSQGPGRLQG